MANKNPLNKFKPGQSGNPKGRPKKGMAMTDLLKEELDAVDKGTGKLKREVIAEKLAAGAMAGDITFIKYVYDRTDGPVKQDINLDGKLEIDEIKITLVKPD